MNPPALQVSRLHKHYGSTVALDGVSFEVAEGELFGLLGPNGAGKTTLLSISGGMKRRLNLGAALIHRPRVILLDEPTTGVDPHSRNHIFDEARRLHALGVTIIYTSHYLEEVQALCPRVAILDRGRLIACAA